MLKSLMECRVGERTFEELHNGRMNVKIKEYVTGQWRDQHSFMRRHGWLQKCKKRSWTSQKYKYYDGCAESHSLTGQETKELEGQRKWGQF